MRVVIVEDEAIVLMHMEMTVEDAGHTVIGTAMGSIEAIELIHRTSPELVLLDIQLKDGTCGMDVARALREVDDLTIVFVTANEAMLDDEMEGAVGVIAKPFNMNALVEWIAYLEECVHRPPPLLNPPNGLRLTPNYLARINGLRAAMK